MKRATSRNIDSTTIHNFRYEARRSIALDHWQGVIGHWMAIDEISIYDSFAPTVGE
jgi:hypothetical protein